MQATHASDCAIQRARCKCDCGVEPNPAAPTPWPEPVYDNDVGPNDEGFWEWWGIEGIAKFDSETDALLAHRAVNSHDSLVKALEKIEKGDGEFSMDPLEHATNCIENMQAIARAALQAEGQ